MRKKENNGRSLFVVYRACSVGSKKPRPILLKDKYELVNFCFTSFRKAFEGIDYKLVVLLDKPNQKFRKLFKGYSVIESFHPDFNTGNTKTFHKQIDLALKQQKNFFFVEDDYFFLSGSGLKIVNAINTLPFITPYDHPGYYSEDIHDYQRSVRLLGNQHWQTIISTTLTFGGQHKALRDEADTMKEYGWADHHMWTDITKRYTLWSPIPTLATHMETPFLAPGINLKT